MEKKVKFTLDKHGDFALLDDLLLEEVQPEIDRRSGHKEYSGSPCKLCERFGRVPTHDCIGTEGCRIRTETDLPSLDGSVKPPPKQKPKKKCVICGKEFEKLGQWSWKHWEARITCSKQCGIESTFRTRLAKGSISKCPF
jgi:hypothetical protein